MCSSDLFILASSLGPRIFVSVSSASVSSNSSSNVSFLNLLERCLDSVLVSRVSCSIGVITKETISSWWRHQNFPTRLLKHGNGNADDPQRDESKHSYQISGFIQIWLVWLSLPAVLHELLTWFGYKQQAKVD